MKKKQRKYKYSILLGWSFIEIISFIFLINKKIKIERDNIPLLDNFFTCA